MEFVYKRSTIGDKMIRTSTLGKWRSSFREQLVELARACLLLAASTPGSIDLQLSTIILKMLTTIVMLMTIDDDVDDNCDVDDGNIDYSS